METIYPCPKFNITSDIILSDKKKNLPNPMFELINNSISDCYAIVEEAIMQSLMDGYNGYIFYTFEMCKNSEIDSQSIKTEVWREEGKEHHTSVFIL